MNWSGLGSVCTGTKDNSLSWGNLHCSISSIWLWPRMVKISWSGSCSIFLKSKMGKFCIHNKQSESWSGLNYSDNSSKEKRGMTDLISETVLNHLEFPFESIRQRLELSKNDSETREFTSNKIQKTIQSRFELPKIKELLKFGIREIELKIKSDKILGSNIAKKMDTYVAITQTQTALRLQLHPIFIFLPLQGREKNLGKKTK